MSVSPKNPWVAKVHSYLLASKTSISPSEAVAMFGRPEGRYSAGERLLVAAQGSWFAIDSRSEAGRKENRYVALEKASYRPSTLGPDARKVKPPSPPKPAQALPIPTPKRFSSVWGYAAAVSAQIPARSAPVVRTTVSPLAQWVSA